MSSHPKRVALITGANRGIGFEIARQLAEVGVHVLLTGRDQNATIAAVQQLKNAGFDADAYTLDVTRPDTISARANEIGAKYGHLDILVNNAAIRIEEYGLQPSEQPMDQWRKTFETNLFGAVAVTKALLPLIKKSTAGRIVNVSSLLASLTTHSNPNSYAYSPMFKSLPGYSASKSALNSWTVHLAYELRDTCIKVNAVHPGYTKTDMNDGDGELEIPIGARTSVLMALLDEDGPSGSFVHMNETVPW